MRGRWLWLFPASYAIHIAEEDLADECFYRWIGQVIERQVSPGAFAGVNLAFEAAMVVAVRRALTPEDGAWRNPLADPGFGTGFIGHGTIVMPNSRSPGPTISI